ncbi:MAG: 2-amino-4-hydroxy-6-hydroxymethyldihydropteridine pyrophosphokinase [Chroococcopsis gigantea SAG 12.99]|nr:2-amino-4-hydroxy-6-hydroxymethyldihydropteridine pyrophosphokinase [Chroococcopsis gigantea SAG 12.99]
MLGEQVKVAIALGSNLGDSEAILNETIAQLDRTEGIEVVSHSSWYDTAPIGPPQPNYLNGCAILGVTLSPAELLRTLLEVEKQFGRIRNIRWGPRTLDLDIIFYDNLILQTPTLEIPHPRFRERSFVLIPLAEIAPDWIDPVTGKQVSQLVVSG